MLNRISKFLEIYEKKRSWRIFLYWIDLILLNFSLYWFTRSLLFMSIGFYSLIEVILYLIIFLMISLGLFFLHNFNKPFKRNVFYTLIQVFSFLAMIIMLYFVAGLETPRKGVDFSWLKVEMIKVPLWFHMFSMTSPLVVLFFFVLLTFLMWLSLRKSISIWIRLLPLLGALALFYHYLSIFSHFRYIEPSIYYVMFGIPPFVFSILFLFKNFVWAFRSSFLTLHLLLIGTHYTGLLPFRPLTTAVATSDFRNGVELILSAKQTNRPEIFSFLRILNITPEVMYLNYGPTCGILRIDKVKRKILNYDINGLMRDVQISPNGKALWTTNWSKGNFHVFDSETLEPKCAINIFRYGIKTPYHFEVNNDLIYISNVTPPEVSEVSFNESECSMKVLRKINFRNTGFTKFTDGAFGLQVANNKLYVQVGLTSNTYETKLIEIDLKDFQPQRSLKIRGGTETIAILNGKRALIPSYYDNIIYEIDLPSLTIVRKIEAEASIIHIAYDQNRSLLYASSRTTGNFLVLDYKTGKILKRLWLGAKPEALQYVAADDAVYVGSEKGLWKISLQRFLSTKI